MTCSLPAISVLCITYKHERFIRQALEGFVMQQLNVPFEVLVGDDCSPDGTAAIVRDFAERYPNIIKPVLHAHNLGAARNLESLVQQIRGRYVAICDGDDYWTDPLKLQKQYDFLESHPDHSMCFHKVRQFFEDGSHPETVIDPRQYLPDVMRARDFFDLGDLLRINVIASLSVMYRWKLGNTLPPWMFNYGVCDLPMHLLHADAGKIGYLDEEMGAYRKHSEGSWWNHESLEHRRANQSRYIALLEDVRAHLGGRHDQAFGPVLRQLKYEMRRLGNARPSRWRALFDRVSGWLLRRN